MKTLSILALCPLLAVAGCGESDSGTDAAPAPATAPAGDASRGVPGPAITLVAMKDETIDVACGKCIYHMDGVEGCEPAVMVMGVPVLLTGVSEEVAHSLCTEPKTAVVSAEVEGDHLHVSKLEIQ